MKTGMEIKMNFLAALVLILVSSCSSSMKVGNSIGVEEIKMNGIIVYNYKNVGASYYLEDINYYHREGDVGIPFIPDAAALKRINDLCKLNLNSDLIDLGHNYKNASLYFSQHYKDQNRRGDNPIHYGGEIYEVINSDNLKIAFRIKGDGVIFKSTCNRFNDFINTNNIEDCQFKQSEINNPFIVLKEYVNTTPLNQIEKDRMQLKEAKFNKFNVMLCE